MPSPPSRRARADPIRPGPTAAGPSAAVTGTSSTARRCGRGPSATRPGCRLGAHRGARTRLRCRRREPPPPGLTVRPIGMLTSFPPYVLHFENVEVPVANRIGAEGAGLALASQFLVTSRITYGAGPIGTAQEALRLVIDWVRTRTTFGTPLADRQAVQW